MPRLLVAAAAALLVLLISACSIPASSSTVRYAALVSSVDQYHGALVAKDEASTSGYTLALEYNITDSASSAASTRYAIDPYTQCPQRASSALSVGVIEALTYNGSEVVRSVSAGVVGSWLLSRVAAAVDVVVLSLLLPPFLLLLLLYHAWLSS